MTDKKDAASNPPPLPPENIIVGGVTIRRDDQARYIYRPVYPLG